MTFTSFNFYENIQNIYMFKEFFAIDNLTNFRAIIVEVYRIKPIDKR